jgi:hypothetical protein
VRENYRDQCYKTFLPHNLRFGLDKLARFTPANISNIRI